jgi:hypothetical protein
MEAIDKRILETGLIWIKGFYRYDSSKLKIAYNPHDMTPLYPNDEILYPSVGIFIHFQN